MAVAAPAAAPLAGHLKDVKEDFPKALYNAGYTTCTAAVSMAMAYAISPDDYAYAPPASAAGTAAKEVKLQLGIPIPIGILAGAAFAGGVCAMYSGVRLASTGVRLSDGAKAAIFTVASLLLAVASGVAGSKFCKLAFNILGAID